MAYNNSIPLSTDLIANSQGQILGNFAAIDGGTTGSTTGGFARNHITLTDATSGGLHYRVDFSQNLSDPTLTNMVSSLYPKLTSSLSQLFFRNSSNIAQLTGLTIVNNSINGNNYGVTTPWGIVLNFGNCVTNSSGKTITYAVPFSSVYSIQATSNQTSPANSATINNTSTTQLTIYSVASNTVFYFAIGV